MSESAANTPLPPELRDSLLSSRLSCSLYVLTRDLDTHSPIVTPLYTLPLGAEMWGVVLQVTDIHGEAQVPDRILAVSFKYVEENRTVHILQL